MMNGNAATAVGYVLGTQLMSTDLTMARAENPGQTQPYFHAPGFLFRSKLYQNRSSPFVKVKTEHLNGVTLPSPIRPKTTKA